IYDRVGPVIVSTYPAGAFQLVAPGNPLADQVTIIRSQQAKIPALTFTFETAGAAGGQLVLQDASSGSELGNQPVTADGTVTLPNIVLSQGRTLNIDVRLTDASGNITGKQLTATVDILPPDVPTDVTFTMNDYQEASGTLAFTEPAGDTGGEGSV